MISFTHPAVIRAEVPQPPLPLEDVVDDELPTTLTLCTRFKDRLRGFCSDVVLWWRFILPPRQWGHGRLRYVRTYASAQARLAFFCTVGFVVCAMLLGFLYIILDLLENARHAEVGDHVEKPFLHDRRKMTTLLFLMLHVACFIFLVGICKSIYYLQCAWKLRHGQLQYFLPENSARELFPEIYTENSWPWGNLERWLKRKSTDTELATVVEPEGRSETRPSNAPAMR